MGRLEDPIGGLTVGRDVCFTIFPGGYQLSGKPFVTVLDQGEALPPRGEEVLQRLAGENPSRRAPNAPFQRGK